MPLSLRWTDPADQSRIALARARCYAHATNDLPSMEQRFVEDPRNGDPDADFLIAEHGGQPVGTATALPLHMWARGGRIPCQGVAWVGTARTHRRRPGGSDAAGVATQIMRETIRRGREREQVVSALMPFRASFYEHFGYGLVERRHDWTLPLSVLPAGDCAGVRHYETGDFDAVCAARQRLAERGQCDIERAPATWAMYHRRAEAGFEFVDRDEDGTVHSWLAVTHDHEAGKDVLRVDECGCADFAALLRQLRFLGTLRDQYAAAILTLAADVPLNRLLREAQIPHRPVNHATGECRPYTRMQVRVLDNKRLLEAMRLPPDVRGGVSIAVRECEGHVSKLWVEIADGHAQVSPTEGEPDFACDDATWAAVACGDLSASAAVDLGLARGTDRRAIGVLDALARGPAPFTLEYF